MPSNRISLVGSELSIARAQGSTDELTLSITITHDQLAELLEPVIDIRSLSKRARASKARAVERAAKERQKQFQDQILRSIDQGRAFIAAFDKRKSAGATQVEAIAFVARDFAVSQGQVSSLMKLARKHDRNARDAKIWRMHEAGKTKASIARKIGIAASTVARVIEVQERRNLFGGRP